MYPDFDDYYDRTKENINKLTNLENICPKQSQLDESLDSASLESLDSEYRLLNKEKKNR